MPEMIPVGNTIKPPDPNQGLNALSSIYGIQQQQTELARSRQALQTGQYQQQTAQAGAQQEQQLMNERQMLQAKVQSGDFGDPNSDDYASKLATWAQGNLPLSGREIAQSALKTQSDKTSLRSSVADLQQKYRTGLGGIVSGFIGGNAQPRAVHDALDEYVQQNPDALGAAHWAENLLDHADKVQDPQAKDHLLSTLASELKGEPQQEAGSVDVGNKVVPGAVSKFGLGFTPQGPAQTKGIPPGWSVHEDPFTHNKYVMNDQTGETKPFGVPFAGSSPQGPPAGPPGAAGPSVSGLSAPQAGNAPPQRAPGQGEVEQQGTATNWVNHQANITAAREANTQLDQIRQARGILSTGLSTGQGAQSLAGSEQLLSQIPGMEGLAGPGSKTEKLDVLNKFLERIGAQSASLMGTPNKTDAAAESLKAQIGSIGYGNAALDKVLKYTASQYAAAQGKDRGEQQFFSTKGNSIVNQDQYEQKWRANYDPRIYQIATETPQEATRQLAQMKKENPKDYVTFLKKYAAIRDMGAAPQ